MHQIANHWTILITFTSQYKHFKVFSYRKCPLQQQRGITRRCHIQTDIWGRELKVCLALTCLFPTPLSVMFVLYCHTTRFEDLCWRAISTDIYKSYTQSRTEKGSNTHTPPLVCSDALTHIRKHIFCCVMRQRSYACQPSTAHTNTCASAKNKTRKNKAVPILCTCLLLFTWYCRNVAPLPCSTPRSAAALHKTSAPKSHTAAAASHWAAVEQKKGSWHPVNADKRTPSKSLTLFFFIKNKLVPHGTRRRASIYNLGLYR